MKKIRLSIWLALFHVCLVMAQGHDTPSYVDHVNVLMGSASSHDLSAGNTYPAIAMPWGMNFWTPQTGKMGDGWQYTYDAKKIRGLKQTHQPSPWINDYGQFSLLPTTGHPVFDEAKRASWFSHKAETATPYYYKVYLADYDITAELCPTERAALLCFTYPANDSSNVVVDAFDGGSWVKVIPEERKVVGYSTKNSGGVPSNFKNYFVIVFDHPFDTYRVTSDGNELDSKAETMGNHAGAIVSFNTHRGEKVMCPCSLLIHQSGTSRAQPA